MDQKEMIKIIILQKVRLGLRLGLGIACHLLTGNETAWWTYWYALH